MQNCAILQDITLALHLLAILLLGLKVCGKIGTTTGGGPVAVPKIGPYISSRS